MKYNQWLDIAQDNSVQPTSNTKTKSAYKVKANLEDFTKKYS